MFPLVSLVQRARGLASAGLTAAKALSAQSDVTGTTTPQATNLSFTAEAGKTYHVRVRGTFQVTGSVGFAWRLAGTATVTACEGFAVASGAALTNVVRQRQTVFGTAGTNLTMNTLPGECDFWWTITCSVGGTVVFQHAPGNSAQTSSAFIGATMLAWEATQV